MSAAGNMRSRPRCDRSFELPGSTPYNPYITFCDRPRGHAGRHAHTITEMASDFFRRIRVDLPEGAEDSAELIRQGRATR
jgi:hypothetical protein